MTDLLLDAWMAVMWKAWWQGSLVVLVVWSICLAIPSMPARCRCWLWRLAILKFMVVLLLPTLVNLPLLPAHRGPEHTAEITTVVPTIQIYQGPLSHTSVLPIPMSKPTPLPILPVVLFLVWIIGFGWSLARLLVAWQGARQLRKQSLAIHETPLIEELAIQARLYGLRNSPALLETEGYGSPMLIGIFRPAIMIPDGTFRRLSPPELAMVLGHELAHIRRSDLLWGLAPAVVRSLFFFHPLVWLSQRRLNLSQEVAADELAILRQHGDPVSYGKLLVSVISKLGPGRLIPTMSMGTAGSVKSLTRRLVAMANIGRASRGIIVSSGVLLAATVLLGIVPWRLVAAEPKDSTEQQQITSPKASEGKAQTESVLGEERPRGNCSISGKVISASTGKPVEHARVYLSYKPSYYAMFIYTASDGTFTVKDITSGPYSLQTSFTPNYQDTVYNPEGKPGTFPEFSLADGEHRSDILLKAKPACRVSGKIVDDNGQVPKNIASWEVMAWFRSNDGKEYENRVALDVGVDGSYSIDGLGGKPVYVMAINYKGAKEGNANPPVYYPGTFSRSDAKLITFDKEQHVNNINITLQREGGHILTGTVFDQAGQPVPEAFVAVNRRDMFFDFVAAYTDEQGRYQIHGLGDGEFQVHVDAVHRGFVRTRTPIDLNKTSKTTQRNFTLNRGVLISGKFVDEKGNDWQIGRSYGFAHIENRRGQHPEFGLFSLTSFRNKYRPQDAEERSGGRFARGDGDYDYDEMIYPTKSTFVIQGMMPGHTMLSFSPMKEGTKVIRILQNGRNIMESGITTEPGQEIRDITIVIGTP